MGVLQTRLKELRAKKGLTQFTLANLLNTSRSTVAMWEAGLNVPSSDMLAALTGILDCTAGYLLGTEDTPTPDGQSLPSNVRPISALHHQRVPLIGAAAAGEPIYAPEDLGVYVTSPVEADAAITVQGDSMEPNYQDGDVVYIKCCPDVPEGAVAVVFLDDEATIKRVYKRPTGLTLISDNMANHPPMMIEFEDYNNVRIFGVPVGYTRIFKPDPTKKVKKGF